MPWNRINALPSGQRWTTTLYAVLYWVGVIAALACFVLTFAGNTRLVWPFEHSGVPLSWEAGALAILAFLGAESCHRDQPGPSDDAIAFGATIRASAVTNEASASDVPDSVFAE